MAFTPLPNFQPGFRLMDGTALNKLVAQSNSTAISGGSAVQTALATVGAGILTAAMLASGLVARTGPVADFTDTTDTGANLGTFLGIPAIGTSFLFIYKNTTAFAATIVGGTGITVSGRTVVPGNSVVEFLITKTASNTYTMFGIGVLQQGIFGTGAFVATPDNGTTQTLTAAMIVGGNTTYHVSTGGATPSLTLPLGTAMDTALPDMRPGQSYVLRVINTNSGNTTIVTNTGWTLSSGTLVLATNTWKEFLVTKTGTGTYTGVNVGSGTFV